MDGYQRYRVLWPLVPAMAMVMIDFTIVSISATTIQRDLGLSETGEEWLATAYALSTAAFIALGGRLGDILGHKRIVVIGIVLFAVSSLLCGLAPDSGGTAEPWLITFRALEGVGGALLIPSTTVLVLEAFPPEDRGKGLAVFFIVAGLFTALGPIAGSYLTEFWTWRAIFWINIPVALFALWELSRSRIVNTQHPSRVDLSGAFLIVAGMGLSVLGVQQSTVWGWGSPATLASIIVGLLLLVAFVVNERRVDDPLIDIRGMAANRTFAVDNVLVFLLFFPWVAVFFFGSIYFQVSVGQAPTNAGYSILTMFYTFFIASRFGGQFMDDKGPKIPIVLGFLVGAVGLGLWATELDQLSLSSTTAGMLVTGAGFGLAMSPLNTDALNRLPSEVRGQGSGVIQTFRNYGSAVGMAVIGTIVASATSVTGGNPALDYADAMETAFWVAAGVMAVGAVLGLIYLPAGKQEAVE
jgi:EmrB/QacA subfamily drug resistance transporter